MYLGVMGESGEPVQVDQTRTLPEFDMELPYCSNGGIDVLARRIPYVIAETCGCQVLEKQYAVARLGGVGTVVPLGRSEMDMAQQILVAPELTLVRHRALGNGLANHRVPGGELGDDRIGSALLVRVVCHGEPGDLSREPMPCLRVSRIDRGYRRGSNDARRAKRCGEPFARDVLGLMGNGEIGHGCCRMCAMSTSAVPSLEFEDFEHQAVLP